MPVFRINFLNNKLQVNVFPLQELACIYRYQFEPLVDSVHQKVIDGLKRQLKF